MSWEQEKYTRRKLKPSAKHGVGERKLDLFPLKEIASSDGILAEFFRVSPVKWEEFFKPVVFQQG